MGFTKYRTIENESHKRIFNDVIYDACEEAKKKKLSSIIFILNQIGELHQVFNDDEVGELKKAKNTITTPSGFQVHIKTSRQLQLSQDSIFISWCIPKKARKRIESEASFHLGVFYNQQDLKSFKESD